MSLTYVLATSEMCTMPVRFSGRVMNAPNFVMDLTLPSSNAPTVNSIYAVLPSVYLSLSIKIISPSSTRFRRSRAIFITASSVPTLAMSCSRARLACCALATSALQSRCLLARVADLRLEGDHRHDRVDHDREDQKFCNE